MYTLKLKHVDPEDMQLVNIHENKNPIKNQYLRSKSVYSQKIQSQNSLIETLSKKIQYSIVLDLL